MATMKPIRGGFQLRADDQRVVNAQKALTKRINEQFIQVGATFLKPASKFPVDDDWYKKLRGDVDLQSWIDDEDESTLNVGFNLQFGWMDIDIDADDPEYNACILAAMEYLGVDTRFRFGRLSVGYPTHVFAQLVEDESGNFEELRKFEPGQIVVNSKRYHTQLRSFPTGTEAKNIARTAKQTVVPGSIYSRKTPGEVDYDLSVWYKPDGTPASAVTEIAMTTPRRCSFTQVVRAVAFGTMAYLLRPHWIEGSRQLTATKVTGWLSRVVKDSAAMNENEALAKEVFCPIDTDSWAEKLLHFLCAQFSDEEPHMRARAYFDARDKLERNPDAKIPGWHSMEEMVGSESLAAMRTVLTPGSDVSVLTQMAERYIYDETDNKYIDRTRHLNYGVFAHDGAELERRHKGDVIFIAGKPREAFKVFESSTMRKRVGQREMYPELDPSAIYRVDVMGRPVSDESEAASTIVFNTWKGWPIGPVAHIDPKVMARCDEYLHQLLKYLTRDNEQQIEWVKDWLAWTFQHPGKKQQIAWVCVGGQGVGKSFFGNVFMQALMRRLWGSASPSVIETKFNIGPFKDKMFVFIDEAKFHSEVGVDEIKKLIRNVDVPGQEKFEEARDYKIYARIMFASNKFDVNVGQRDVRDRALFYTRAYDKDHLKMGELEFRSWTVTLKPWFQEFSDMLEDEAVLQHFIRMFMDRPVDRFKIESIEHSSSNDTSIVTANMTWPRRIAKAIIESGWVVAEDLAIEMPFLKEVMYKRVNYEAELQGMGRVQAARVWSDLEEAGVLKKTVSGYAFTHRYGDLLSRYSEVAGVQLEPYRELEPEDFGENNPKPNVKLRRKGALPSLSGDRY